MTSNTTLVANTNQKGQLVIPKEIRDKLNIDETVNLLIKLIGKSITISPISAYITQADSEDSYLDILHKTKGSWKNDTTPDKEALELAASQKRSAAW